MFPRIYSPKLYTEQKHLTPTHRRDLTELLSQFVDTSSVLENSVFLAVNILDRFLARDHNFSQEKYTLLGIVCLRLAEKISNCDPNYSPDIDEYLVAIKKDYTKAEFIQLEAKVILTLQFSLYSQTILSLYRKQGELSPTVIYVAESILSDYEMLKYDYRTLTIALRCIFSPVVTFTDITECLKDINRSLILFGSSKNTTRLGITLYDLDTLFSNLEYAEILQCMDEEKCKGKLDEIPLDKPADKSEEENPPFLTEIDDKIYIEKIGQGTYGEIYATDDKKLALKKYINIDNDGLPFFALKEICILKELSHRSIISCTGASLIDNRVCMSMECMEIDLYELNKFHGLNKAEMKYILKEILEGIRYLHSLGLIHQDIKVNNILLTNSSGPNKYLTVKIADFNMCNQDCFKKEHFSDVCSVMYKPPEVLLRMAYGPEVDMWCLGCIMVEMIRRKAFSYSKTPDSAIQHILKFFGKKFSQEMYTALSEEFKEVYSRYVSGSIIFLKLEDILPLFSDRHGIDLLTRLLDPDPKKRITAEKASQHVFFATMD